jgi:hypothetical protein
MPQAAHTRPFVFYRLSGWFTVHVEKDGVFLLGIEIGWFDTPAIQQYAIIDGDSEEFHRLAVDGLYFVVQGLVGL